MLGMHENVACWPSMAIPRQQQMPCIYGQSEVRGGTPWSYNPSVSRTHVKYSLRKQGSEMAE